jgi:hypothetical protein
MLKGFFTAFRMTEGAKAARVECKQMGYLLFIDAETAYYLL